MPDVSSQLIAHCSKHSAWIQVPSCVTWGVLWDLSVPSRGRVEWIWSWHESDRSPPRLVLSVRWDNIHEVCQHACDTREHTPNVCCSWSARSTAWVRLSCRHTLIWSHSCRLRKTQMVIQGGLLVLEQGFPNCELEHPWPRNCPVSVILYKGGHACL